MPPIAAVSSSWSPPVNQMPVTESSRADRRRSLRLGAVHQENEGGRAQAVELRGQLRRRSPWARSWPSGPPRCGSAVRAAASWTKRRIIASERDPPPTMTSVPFGRAFGDACDRDPAVSRAGSASVGMTSVQRDMRTPAKSEAGGGTPRVRECGRRRPAEPLGHAGRRVADGLDRTGNSASVNRVLGPPREIAATTPPSCRRTAAPSAT